jgi:hypothetical protein
MAELIALVVIVIGVIFSFGFALYPFFISPFFQPFWLAGFLRNLITQFQLVLPLVLAQFIGLGALWIQVRSVWRWQRLARLRRWLAAGIVLGEALFVMLPLAWEYRLPFTVVATPIEFLTLGLLVVAVLGCVALAIVGRWWGWLTLLLIPLVIAAVDFTLMQTTQVYALEYPLYVGIEASLFISLAFALFGSASAARRSNTDHATIG